MGTHFDTPLGYAAQKVRRLFLLKKRLALAPSGSESPSAQHTARVAEISFAERVREAVRRIPKGQTRSYGDVACAVGRPGAARAVGTVMKNNYDPSIPCHRVI